VNINDAVWDNYDSSGQIKAKLELIKSWIPEDVKTIADIGCGNGLITNYLGMSYDVTGVDISQKALAHLKTKKVMASATCLPFPNLSFDLVFSSEMMEHLTAAETEKVASEFARIGSHYILISVPNHEQLAKSMVKCLGCKNPYHAYGHLQVFTKRRLKMLFPGFSCVKSLVFGPTERAFNPILLFLNHYIAGQYFHPTTPVVCPVCRREDFVFRSNLLSKAVNLMNRAISCPKPYWLMLLLKR